MKVSVLIPVYNGARHLRECLDSVLGQDFADMEILISDDDSSDGTSKIIENFAARDGRIRWWRNSRNLGLVGNHNASLQAARGDYIKFVHQDDKLLSPCAITKLAAALDAHPSAVLAGSRQHLTDASKKPVILSRQPGRYEGRRFMVACLEQNTNLVGQPTLAMFRRTAAQRGFDPRFTGHLDYEMWFHLLEQGDFVFLPEALATWRVHENHQTARNRASGVKDHEHLWLVESYFAKPWFQSRATPRMLFAQIHHLHKLYGDEAGHLISAMKARLSWQGYAWECLKYKATRPFQKLARKFSS